MSRTSRISRNWRAVWAIFIIRYFLNSFGLRLSFFLQADAAYALIESSKSTVEVNPATAEVKSADPKDIFSARAKKSPKKAPLPTKQEEDQATIDEDEAKWAEENRLLEEQIAAAKAILAKASPNTKPLGSTG